MAREIPEAVRAVAGLAATVVDEARKLPESLPGLPVRALGLAMQLSMKVQQHYAGLVARGDELFTGIRGEDEPGLATFDEDLEPAPATGFRESAFDRVSEADLDDELPEEAGTGVVVTVDEIAEAEDGEAVLEELAIEELVDDEAAGLPAEPTPATVVSAVEDITEQVEAADTGAVDRGLVTADADALENALLESDRDADGLAEGEVLAGSPAPEVDVPAPGGVVEAVPATVTDEGIATPETAPQTAPETAPEATTEAAPEPTPDTAGTERNVALDITAPATPPIEGYDDFSIAQLRGRLRGYAASTVQELLGYEEAAQNRAPYVRMLRNRLERLQSEG